MKFKKEFLITTLLSLTSTSHAFDWFVDPHFTVTERYTDNLRLLVKPTRDNLITTLTPSMHFGYLADNNELKGSFLWNQYLYHGESTLDFSEKIVNLNHAFTADRWRTNVTGRYAIESTITTQTDVNSGGFVVAQLPRTTENIAPDITYQLTEKNSLQFGASYLDVSFDKHPNLAFTNYTNSQLFSTLNHTYTEQLSFNLTGSYSLYDTGTNGGVTFLYNNNPLLPYQENYKQNSATTTIQVGSQYLFDEQTTFSATAGLRDTNSHTAYQCSGGFLVPGCPSVSTQYSSTTNGKIFSAALKRSFERGNINLSANQQLNPASTGSQQQSTVLNASGNYEISDRWSMGISGMYQIVDVITPSRSPALFNFNRHLTTISPNVQWKWTHEVSLLLSYTYTDQYFPSSNVSAKSDSIQLQFNYQPLINRQVK
ncbi:hypothetical protein KEF85_12490 [Methylomonas paludis]|uniref:TIGR03016 family PEP-CTERM system-associated outer membrane protein n=1 Tax=Methylomonas paludis TaxID=1173101 RepID=A0A975R8M0_9GAMM|nr:hypothetical protein [Methylomonas paludis]QWF70157.1 hypothetical protein KEF85_12490 [Methylomonas paludis]